MQSALVAPCLLVAGWLSFSQGARERTAAKAARSCLKAAQSPSPSMDALLPGGHHARIGRLGLAPSQSALTAALMLVAGLAAISLAACARVAAAAARASSARRALTPELLAAWRATLVEAAEPDQARLGTCSPSNRSELKEFLRACIMNRKRPSNAKGPAQSDCRNKVCASLTRKIFAASQQTGG